MLLLTNGSWFCMKRINILDDAWVKPMVFVQHSYLKKKIDVMHYDKVYKLSIIPCATELDDDRKDARKNFYKY